MTVQANRLLKAGPGFFTKRFFTVNALFLLANLLLILGFFSQLGGLCFANFFNSDSLYLPSLYRDLFVDKNSLQGWHLNPAPNFFPDMLFYFLLMFVLNKQFILASFIFALVQYFLVLYLLVRLFKAILPGQSPLFHNIIYCLQAIWLLEFFYFGGNFIFAYFLFSNSYHTGCFVIALSCLLLPLAFIKHAGWGRALLLFMLVFLSTLSDKLFAIAFVIPAALAGLFLIRRSTRAALVLIAVPVLSAIL